MVMFLLYIMCSCCYIEEIKINPKPNTEVKNPV